MRQAKTILTILVTILLAGYGMAAAQENPQVVFDRANDQLAQGNYRNALEMYKKLENSERVSGSLYLNMAISFIELDSLGKGKYYLLKARQYEETEVRAEEGLQYVDSRFSRQSAVLPKLPWEQFFDWLNDVFGPFLLMGIGLFLLNLGIAGFVVHWFIRQYNTYTKIGGLVTSILGILIILTSFYLHYLENRYSSAVMVHQQANVREHPTEDAPVISQAYEGYTFTVDCYESNDQQGWKYVRMSNGLYGWIPEGEILVL